MHVIVVQLLLLLLLTMEGGGSYFRGTASDQDPFLKGGKTGDQKLMATMKFPKSFDK